MFCQIALAVAMNHSFCDDISRDRGSFYHQGRAKPGSHVPDPGSHVPDPGSHVSDLGSHVPDPGSQYVS